MSIILLGNRNKREVLPSFLKYNFNEGATLPWWQKAAEKMSEWEIFSNNRLMWSLSNSGLEDFVYSAGYGMQNSTYYEVTTGISNRAQMKARQTLIPPVSVAWRDWEYFNYSLDGILVYHDCRIIEPTWCQYSRNICRVLFIYEQILCDTDRLILFFSQ